MAIPAADHHCSGAPPRRGYTLRVLTGKIVYRLTSLRNDQDGGRCVHVRQVMRTGELGPRKLISLRRLALATERTEPHQCQTHTTSSI